MSTHTVELVSQEADGLTRRILDYGGMYTAYVVTGPEGAVAFSSTGMDLSWHAHPVEGDDGDDILSHCELVGGPCISSGGTHAARELYRVWQNAGAEDEWLWAQLTDFYAEKLL